MEGQYSLYSLYWMVLFEDYSIHLDFCKFLLILSRDSLSLIFKPVKIPVPVRKSVPYIWLIWSFNKIILSADLISRLNFLNDLSKWSNWLALLSYWVTNASFVICNSFSQILDWPELKYYQQSFQTNSSFLKYFMKEVEVLRHFSSCFTVW